MYMQLEAADAVQQSRLRPKSCPVPRKEDCIEWMASVWSNPDVHAAVADVFWKTGLACSLDDDADDRRVVKEACTASCRLCADWNELGIPAKRQEAVHIVKAEYDAGGILTVSVGWRCLFLQQHLVTLCSQTMKEAMQVMATASLPTVTRTKAANLATMAMVLPLLRVGIHRAVLRLRALPVRV